MEDVEGKVRHARSEAEARGVTGGGGEVGLAAAVAAPAQRAPQQRRRWKEAEKHRGDMTNSHIRLPKSKTRVAVKRNFNEQAFLYDLQHSNLSQRIEIPDVQ